MSKKKVAGADLPLSDEKEMLARRLAGAHFFLGQEQQKSEVVRLEKEALKEKIAKLASDLLLEKKNSTALNSEFATKKREIENQFLEEIERLERYIREKENEIISKGEEMIAQKREFESQLSKKDEEIKVLKSKMDEMTVEFSRILKVTSEASLGEDARLFRNQRVSFSSQSVSCLAILINFIANHQYLGHNYA